jgi:hypothetical protein
MGNKDLKIVFWDVETSPIIAATWHLYPKAISHDSILKDWFIICGAWKELGKDKVHAVKVTKAYDDYNVVKALRDTLASADIIVHHNGDKFDIKKLNARIIHHRLEPLPPLLCVDTLKEARKIASFTSNRLDYLTKSLVGAGKVSVGYDLWLKAMEGNKRAIKEMLDYNKVDVIRLEELYMVLRPYMKAHPHVGALSGLEKSQSCSKCGSAQLKRNGIRYTAAGLVRQEVQCKKCGAYSRFTINKTLNLA